MRLTIGDRTLVIAPQRGMTGKLFDWQSVIAPPERGAGGVPYAVVSVQVVHRHGCAATRNGKRSGPCDCGGEDLLAELAAEDGTPLWDLELSLRAILEVA